MPNTPTLSGHPTANEAPDSFTKRVWSNWAKQASATKTWLMYRLLLHKEGVDQVALKELTPLAQSLTDELDDRPSEWDHRLVADLHTLHEAGITSVEDLLTADRTHVQPSTALRNMLGKHKVKQSHHSAWRRLAHYLIHATPWVTEQSTP